MRVKFTEQDLTGNKYLNEGKHNCTIASLEHKQSKKGDPMLEITFQDHAQRTTRDWFMITNPFKLGALAIAAGFEKGLLESGDWDTAMLQGRKVVVVREKVGEEMYEGKMRPRYENTYLKADGARAASSEDIPF